MKINQLIGFTFIIISLTSCQQLPKQQQAPETADLTETTATTDQVWVIACAPNDESSCGFKNAAGDLEIAYGKYPMIFTDTFRNYAIVVDENSDIVGIDKAENVLYNIFTYDNGPDYVEDGYFRIVVDGKIGFADAQTGEVKINPQYAAARPFQNGYAAICPDCESQQEGEHSSWVNGKWGIMDKEGKVVVDPTFDKIGAIDEKGKASVIEAGVEKVLDLTEMR